MSSQSLSVGDVLRGAVAGMIGGAVASWAMNQFQAAQQEASRRAQQGQPAEQGGEASSRQQASSQSEQEAGGEDATVKTAQVISRGLFEHELSPTEKQLAGPLVHYSYGTLVGGIYGALAEISPLFTTGFGMVYGMALFLLGDEVAVPALGLGPPPTQTPVTKHADYLAAHLCYGITLDFTRRIARHLV